MFERETSLNQSRLGLNQRTARTKVLTVRHVLIVLLFLICARKLRVLMATLLCVARGAAAAGDQLRVVRTQHSRHRAFRPKLDPTSPLVLLPSAPASRPTPSSLALPQPSLLPAYFTSSVSSPTRSAFPTRAAWPCARISPSAPPSDRCSPLFFF